MSMQDRILLWFARGERGVSSEAMACALVDITPEKRWANFGNNPSDPDDLKRCIRLLEFAPEARFHMDKVAAISPIWKNLVDNWVELENLFNEEFPTGKAPKTYARMKELGC